MLQAAFDPATSPRLVAYDYAPKDPPIFQLAANPTIGGPKNKVSGAGSTAKTPDSGKLAGVINPYVYVQNNPVNLIDPDGLNPGPIHPGSGPFPQANATSGIPIIDHTVLGMLNTAANTTNWFANSAWPLLEPLLQALSSEFMMNSSLTTPFPGDDILYGCASGILKAVNLPSWKRSSIDMEHIISGHMMGGSRVSPLKTLFPETMNAKQVGNAIREAYRYGSRVATQGEAVLAAGQYSGLNIEMWVNRATNTIEAAYPIY